jgi:hypothetical protein
MAFTRDPLPKSRGEEYFTKLDQVLSVQYVVFARPPKAMAIFED